MIKLVTKLIQLSVYLPFLLLCRIFFNFHVQGQENLRESGDSFILAVNHVTYMDPVQVLLAMPFRLKYIPLYYMADDYLYKRLPFYRFTGAIRAHIESRNLELSCMPLIEKLDQGERVVIFPEGGINRGGIKRRPRRGISYIAAKSNRMIVPLKVESNLDATVNVLGGYIKDLLIRKHWVKIIIGKPFKIEETIGRTPETLSELRMASDAVFKRIESAENKI